MRIKEYSSNATVFAVVLVVLLITQIGGFYGCLQPERQALLNFKRRLSFLELPFKAGENRLLSWEDDGDCCEWEGISCDNVTRHIVMLNLSDPCSLFFNIDHDCFPSVAFILEDINPYLSQLQHLTYLDLSRVVFINRTPTTFLASMQHLRYLSLQGGVYDDSSSPLVTTIPSSSIRNLTNLRALYLADLTLTNATDSTWLAPLSSLQYLGLGGVDLSMDLFKVLNTLPSLLHLHLPACGLGQVSSALVSDSIFPLTNLTRLQLLNLAWNGLNQDSPVLHAFRNITSIKVLHISGNLLSSVPSWLAQLQNLVNLDLSFNNVKVLDPLRNLTSIKDLQLSHNQNLTWLPLWFSHFDNIQVLSLQGCGLSGELSSTLQNMTSIRSLDLSENNLSSTMPLWLGRFENLVSLELSNNLLYGSVPYALRNLTSLTHLSLFNNNLNSLPSWLGELKSLVYLVLSENNFTSVKDDFLSSTLSNLCHLEVFDLSESNCQGFAFKNKGTLSSCNSYPLEYMSLSDNEFGGLFPNWLGQFKNLKYLDLRSNSFSGPLPFSIENLTKLSVLNLGGNILNGSIPQSLAKLVNLQNLDLSSNYFNGEIPQNLGQLKSLQWLDLSYNYLQGTLNELINSWPQLMNLMNLDLSYNQIIGSIPESLPDKMPKLHSLFLHDNLINGSLPNSLGKLESLYSFDVSNNKLSSEIPSTIWNLSSLEWLHLNNNKFQGKLPSSLTSMKDLTLLDLGENQLTGVIPSWNGSEFSHLQILRMRRNFLHGGIPSSFCKVAALQILDLAENNLVGPIPHCVGNITGMTSAYNSSSGESSGWGSEIVKQVIKGRELDYIRNLKYVVNLDFSNNFLSGSIPAEISSLSRLIGLNLSFNDFFGEIPKMIGDMKSLESIDLSHNHLSGAIPKSMIDLNFLSHLNLSYNNLSGSIPDENQFQVLNDPLSYTGNQYLCGAPLPKHCPSDGPHHVHDIEGYKEEDRENDKLDKELFYSVIALGFATGFWGIIGVLYFKKNWRYVCFGYVDKVADRIYVAVVLKVVILKEMMQKK